MVTVKPAGKYVHKGMIVGHRGVPRRMSKEKRGKKASRDGWHTEKRKEGGNNAELDLIECLSRRGRWTVAYIQETVLHMREY